MSFAIPKFHSQDDYQPSQEVDTIEIHHSLARNRMRRTNKCGPRVSIKGLYAPGGALHSQTTDSQWLLHQHGQWALTRREWEGKAAKATRTMSQRLKSNMKTRILPALEVKIEELVAPLKRLIKPDVDEYDGMPDLIGEADLSEIARLNAELADTHAWLKEEREESLAKDRLIDSLLCLHHKQAQSGARAIWPMEISAPFQVPDGRHGYVDESLGSQNSMGREEVVERVLEEADKAAAVEEETFEL
ncbi:hypothetical protein EIP91_001168 [Steccherinum ochraceum]|uniref:Uncharacterized protein n=1 Tax=Steccherinum ochraceum TaxID=92696 RepID=A0A4R0RPT1_9APHY|nr:hypothetical protein EIP91_001168 [Steccherinum ochraceum]